MYLIKLDYFVIMIIDECYKKYVAFADLKNVCYSNTSYAWTLLVYLKLIIELE